MKTQNLLKALLFSSACIVFISCKKNQEFSSETKQQESITKNKDDNEARTLSTLWNGDASLGNSIWKVATNIEGSGTITTPTDTKYGEVWRFYKPSGSHRTEAHAAAGFTAQEGDDIYIGWNSKVNIPLNIRTNAFFQWKAYGANMLQNYPIVINSDGNGLIRMIHWAPAPNHDSTHVWSTALSTNTWNDFVMRLKVSRNASVGFIEFWYNGVKQDLAGGSQRYYCRTLDADHCDPKWGVYGGDAANITNDVSELRIASTYIEAARQVRLYGDCSFGGWSVNLGIGEYTLSQLTAMGFVNDQTSSIRVPAGMKITVYTDNNFGGSSNTLTSNNSCLGTVFNNSISSLKVSYN